MSDSHPIAAARKAKNWSQDDLAGRIGVTAMTVSRWERGECLPNRKHYPKIEEHLEVPRGAIVQAYVAAETAGATP